MRPATARVLAFTLCAFLLAAFGTPLRGLWAQPGAPWWGAYALWALSIAGLYLLERRSPREPAAAADERAGRDHGSEPES